MKQQQPEILAPVGNWEMAKAAIHNGADAIYLGLPGFNARGRTELMSVDTVGEIIEFCHIYGTKVFIAANILIFERELPEIQSLLEQVLPLQPDAFIVQDIGLVRLIHAICPEQVLHASTQMTVTSYEAVEMTADLSLQRYVLGRENSIEEIKKIRDKTDKELEVFVHGALCVSYSGQCLTSESFGGRSANRGQCAQSCRLPYDLIVDGKKIDDGRRPYMVSPQDLCGLDDIPRLMEVGVDSFKIEGRLKSPAYVADTVRHYKAAVVGATARLHGTSKDAKHELAKTYSRGFFNGWLDGVNHQALVDGRYSNHHGSAVGTAVSILSEKKSKKIIASLTHPLEAGDGVLFSDFSQPVVKQTAIGASIFSVIPGPGNKTTLSFANDFQVDSLTSGMTIFNNKSSHLEKDLARSFTVREELRRIPISVRIKGNIGERATLSFTDDSGRSIEVQGDAELVAAQKIPLPQQKIIDELTSLSHTPYIAADVQIDLDKAAFVPHQIIKDLKKRAVKALTEKRVARPIKNIAAIELDSLGPAYSQPRKSGIDGPATPSLAVLVRDSSQLDAFENLSVDTIYLDFEYGKEYQEASKRVREMGAKVGIATTRIYKPGELGHLKVIERIRPDYILIRNLGALHYFQEKGIPLRGDFSLNVTNSISADWFLSKNLETICPSYDLNSSQLFDLVERIGSEKTEVTVHQYMPAFHMEHCVFAAFLSEGKSFHDCGKPCERHRVELRDPKGVLHPLKPDGECRNTMFNGKAQSAIRLLPTLRAKGVSHFRIEALFETPGELREKIVAYRELLKGNVLDVSALKKLEATEQYGITEGQLFNIRTYQDRRKGAAAAPL